MSGRVLVVSPWGLAGGYSGPVTLMNRLFRAVAATGVDVDVLHRDRGTEVAPGWPRRATALLGSSGGRFGAVEQLRWVWAVTRHLRTHRADYDTIHFHGCYLLNLLPVLAVARPTTVVLFPVLEAGDLRVTGRPAVARLKRWLTRRAVSRADVGFALSAGIAAELAGHGLATEQTVTVGNVVSTAEFALDSARPTPGRPLRLGFVGKLGETKQPHLVLEAVALLRASDLDATALFVGPYFDEAYRSRFETLIDTLSLREHVQVTGFTENVAGHVRSDMDIFVLPSGAEGMPGALAEAMMSGLPCVVTDVGAMGETVRTARCGVVVTPEAASLVSAVSTMATDPDRWRRYSDAAADYAAVHFADSAIARRYVAHAVSPTPSDDVREDLKMTATTDRLPGLESLRAIMTPYLGRRAYVIGITSADGRSLGNNGDYIMQEVFTRILASFDITTVASVDQADLLIVPPSGALLEVYQFPQILAERLRGHESVPLVIFPSSALFPARDPAFMFAGRTADTVWIMREKYSYDHLREQWLDSLTAAGVELRLDHDVVASGHDFVLDIMGGAGSGGGALVAGRRDKESGNVRSGGTVTGNRLTSGRLGSLAKLVPYGRLYTAAVRYARRRELDQAASALLAKLPPAYRRDVESSGKRTSVDLSATQYATYPQYLHTLRNADLVVTNRLHVALPAAILGKRVFMVEAGYHKLQGVYEQSLTGLDNLSLTVGP